MKKPILFYFFFALFAMATENATAQSADQQKARAYYLQAESAYENEQWSKTLEYLDEVEKLLGQSNATIASLRVKALFESRDYAEAKKALDRFFEMDPAASLVEKMSGYLIKIDEAIEKQKVTLFDPRDGQTYRKVKIGNQVWMAENLRYKTENTSYQKGDSDGSFGLFYEWSEARNICPDGWHLPSIAECNILFNYLKDNGFKPSIALKSTTGWKNGPNGTNSSGFNAYPWGLVSNPPYGTGDWIDEHAYFWTSSYRKTEDSVYFIQISDTIRNRYDDPFFIGKCPVRCIKNSN